MVSLKDIADEAQVSVTTVSLVLADKAESVGIKEATRQRVRHTAERLGYRPHLTARGLRTGRTYTVGLLFYNPRELIYAELISAIQALLQPHGYAALCAFWDRMETAPEAFRSVLGRGVDALVTSHDDVSLVPADMPAVLVFQDDGLHDSVCRDGPAAMRLAAHHLLDLGHRQLGVVGLNRATHGPLLEAALRERGLKQEVRWAHFPDDDYIAASRKGAAALLELPRASRPTALICRNDTAAMIAMSEAGRRGLRVPDDLSIIGFDAVSVGAITNPPLTSVGVPPAVLARRVANMLVRRLTRPDEPRRALVLAPQLVSRQSCAYRPKLTVSLKQPKGTLIAIQ